MKKLKVAVIGIGNMGMRHARVYSELDSCDLLAVSDVDKSRISDAKKFTDFFYDDYKKMIDSVGFDLISICVPTNLHYKIAKECISRKINVLLEKPITNSYKNGEELLELAKKNKVKLLVGHIERFNPGILKVKEILEKKELGKIISIIARRVGGPSPQIQDADVALDLGIHDVDIINYLMNEIPNKVIINRQRSLTLLQDDSAEFFLKFESGTSAYIQTNWITPSKIRTLSITGLKGYLELNYIKQEIKLFKSVDIKLKNTQNFSDFIEEFGNSEKTIIEVAKKEPLKEELSYFINCIQNNIRVNSQFALDALKICLIK